jgi:hypothetical protein
MAHGSVWAASIDPSSNHCTERKGCRENGEFLYIIGGNVNENSIELILYEINQT